MGLQAKKWAEFAVDSTVFHLLADSVEDSKGKAPWRHPLKPKTTVYDDINLNLNFIPSIVTVTSELFQVEQMYSYHFMKIL